MTRAEYFAKASAAVLIPLAQKLGAELPPSIETASEADMAAWIRDISQRLRGVTFVRKDRTP